MFSSGVPDGNVTWQVLGPSGQVLDSGVIDPAADAVSTIIAVDAEHNALTNGDLLSYRDVTWSYSVNGQTIYDELRYSVEARIPFGAAPDGVRTKLGVEDNDLPNTEISLVGAYYAFAELVSEPTLTAATLLGSRQQLKIRDAIEALAALALLPTMVVRVAAKESSGTQQYQRQKIDWLQVQLSLEAMIGAGRLLLVPSFDVAAGFGALLIIASPETDPFSG
jgi:hypothetical protein